MTLAPETTDLKVQLQLENDWFAVCELNQLVPGRGVAARDGRETRGAMRRERSSTRA